MAYTEDLKIAKFLVKHNDKMTYIFKYYPRDDVYILFKSYRRKEFKCRVYSAIDCMENNTIFTAVYDSSKMIRTIYQIWGVRA